MVPHSSLPSVPSFSGRGTPDSSPARIAQASHHQPETGQQSKSSRTDRFSKFYDNLPHIHKCPIEPFYGLQSLLRGAIAHEAKPPRPPGRCICDKLCICDCACECPCSRLLGREVCLQPCLRDLRRQILDDDPRCHGPQQENFVVREKG